MESHRTRCAVRFGPACCKPSTWEIETARGIGCRLKPSTNSVQGGFLRLLRLRPHKTAAVRQRRN